MDKEKVIIIILVVISINIIGFVGGVVVIMRGLSRWEGWSGLKLIMSLGLIVLLMVGRSRALCEATMGEDLIGGDISVGVVVGVAVTVGVLLIRIRHWSVH